MKFSTPYMFYLLWAVVVLGGVTVYGIRKRTRILSQFVSLSLVPHMAPGAGSRRRWTKGGLLLAVLLTATLALTGPLVGFRWEKVAQKGVDIMIVLDCSRSMLATDIKPSRLERAKREIMDLLQMMQSDRAGLVAFSGSAVLQCPLTLDHSAFSLFLKALSPDYLPMGGTDISGAIETALSGFEWETPSEKAIIIITDGENTAGDPEALAGIADEKEVRIFCIGVGQAQGAPIPDAGGGFKKDAHGNIVMSRVDDEGLSRIAALARGIYVKSVAGDMDLDRIYTGEILKKMERTTIHSGRKKVWENRFQWLLLPGVLLLFLELLISEKGRNENRTSRQASVSVVGLILGICVLLWPGGALLPATARAGASKSVRSGVEAYQKGEWEQAEKNFIDAQLDRPDMLELYYNIGAAAYKKGDYESALANFTRAMDTDDEALKQKAAFNLGNSRYRNGDLEGAMESFATIPESSPLFTRAEENLAFVKQKLEEQKQEEQKKNDQEQNSSDQESSRDEKKDGSEKSGAKPGDKKEQNTEPASRDQDNKEQQDTDPQNGDQQTKDGSGENSPGDASASQQKGAPEENKSTMPSPQSSEDGNKPPETSSGPDEQKEAEPSQSRGADQSKADGAQGAGAAPGEAASGGPDDETGETPENARGMEVLQPYQQQMLDRLTDQPGRAMMPAYSGGTVEKDW